MNLLPRAVADRLASPEDRAFYLRLGPVTEDAGSTLGQALADTIAQAVMHDQRDLALALANALVALNTARPTEAAA